MSSSKKASISDNSSVREICFQEEENKSDERLYPHLSLIERNRFFNSHNRLFF